MRCIIWGFCCGMPGCCMGKPCMPPPAIMKLLGAKFWGLIEEGTTCPYGDPGNCCWYPGTSITRSAHGKSHTGAAWLAKQRCSVRRFVSNADSHGIEAYRAPWRHEQQARRATHSDHWHPCVASRDSASCRRPSSGGLRRGQKHLGASFQRTVVVGCTSSAVAAAGAADAAAAAEGWHC